MLFWFRVLKNDWGLVHKLVHYRWSISISTLLRRSGPRKSVDWWWWFCLTLLLVSVLILHTHFNHLYHALLFQVIGALKKMKIACFMYSFVQDISVAITNDTLSVKWTLVLCSKLYHIYQYQSYISHPAFIRSFFILVLHCSPVLVCNQGAEVCSKNFFCHIACKHSSLKFLRHSTLHCKSHGL